MKPPKIDATTREYLRKWTPFEVPTAQVTGGKVPNPGTYRALPILGWMEHQETRLGKIAICGVHFILVRKFNFEPFATLSLGMPVTKTTELHVNSFLCLLGWDGRVWPNDKDEAKWPENSPKDVEQITTMLKVVKVGATLTFPPSGPGVPLLELPVYKTHSPYQVAPWLPLPEDKDSPAVHIDRFRALCQDPTIFELVN